MESCAFSVSSCDCLSAGGLGGARIGGYGRSTAPLAGLLWLQFTYVVAGGRGG